MSKYFRPWNIDQTLLLPPHVQDFVPKGHVSRFIVELVRESLDLKEITGSYVSGLGQPPFDPRMMVALLLHGYSTRDDIVEPPTTLGDCAYEARPALEPLRPDIASTCRTGVDT